MRGCCGPAPSWVSSWSTVSPEGQKGKGKIERFFRTVRDQFLVELTEERAARVQDLAELNKLFTAWTETVYHVREHSETGQPPLARWDAGGPFPLPRRRRTWRGVPLVRMADRLQDGPRLPARQPVPGRPGAGPPPRGAGLRPVRPDRAVRPAQREGRRDRDPASHHPALPPQGPAGRPRQRRRRPPRHRRRLHRPARRAARPGKSAARSTTTPSPDPTAAMVTARLRAAGAGRAGSRRGGRPWMTSGRSSTSARSPATTRCSGPHRR